MPDRYAAPPQPRVLVRPEGAIVVDKPSGWLVHPAGTEAPDLLGWLRSEAPGRWSPVHRLDGGTSGPVVFAVPEHVESWNRTFRDHAVEKTYLALVYGQTRSKGTIRRPLADARRGHPLPAESRYRTLETFARWSLVEVHPITGRKHQIRRHLQGIGHAVIGDERYRPRGKRTVPAFPGRLWLHCTRLALRDLVVESPLPQRLQEHLAVLRA